MLILLLKPFKVGDYIIEHSHNNEGTVTEDLIFIPNFFTVDNKLIVIPNGTLSNSSPTNVTNKDRRRWISWWASPMKRISALPKMRIYAVAEKEAQNPGGEAGRIRWTTWRRLRWISDQGPG